MKSFEDFEVYRNNEKSTNTILLLVGIIAIIAGALLRIYTVASTILLSIGTSVTAGALMSLLNSKYTIKKEEEEELKKWGIKAIYSTRQKMNDPCDELLKRATKEVEMTGFGFRSLRDSQEEIIGRKLSEGVSFKILTLDPDSVFVKYREKDENAPEGNIRDSIIKLAEWADRLNSRSRKGKIQIRYYDSLPQDFYFRIDSAVFVGPYIRNKLSQQTILYEYQRGKGQKYYQDYFRTIWNDKNFCHEGRKEELCSKRPQTL